MSETAREFLERVSRGVQAVFNSLGEIQPMIHIVTHDKEEALIPIGMPTKDLAAIFTRLVLRATDATRYAFIDECWTVHRDDFSQADLDRFAEYGCEFEPGREEVVLISVEDATEGMITGEHQIIRPADGPPHLGELKIDIPAASEGRFIGLLASTEERKHNA